MRRSFACGILLGIALWGADLPSFDVASVRPGSHPTINGLTFSSHQRTDATHFRAINCDLSELIEWAYDIRTDRVSGPAMFIPTSSLSTSMPRCPLQRAMLRCV